MGANIVEQVREQAKLRPASPAIIHQDKVITYGQLNVSIGVLARHLRQQGVTPGQVVGISMGQNPLHVATLLALAQVGAVSLPLHVAVPADRRALAAQRFGATAIVSGSDAMALPGLQFISLAKLSFDGSSHPPDLEIQELGAHATCRIATSSGTSGDPKAVLWSHGLVRSRNSRPEPGFSLQSRSMPMDMNFIVGFGPVFRTLSMGACLVLPRSMDPDTLLQTIVMNNVTHTTLSPSQAHSIVDRFAVDGIHCPSLVCLRIGGGPLPMELMHKIKRTLTPHVYVAYGSTECGALSYAGPEILDRHPNSAGKVNDWARIEVVDEQDQPLPALKIGQLRIRSEDMATAYYRDEERTRQQFRGGWFYPGDLGGFDEEGLLYLEGRADDQLNIGGSKVNPEDIDAALAAHPGVVEAGAFLFSGEEGNEQLAVAVVLRDAGGLEEVRAYVRNKLGPLGPTRYFVVPTLPRTITGKLRRAELTAQLSKPEPLQ